MCLNKKRKKIVFYTFKKKCFETMVFSNLFICESHLSSSTKIHVMVGTGREKETHLVADLY